ncbi:TetR/AcrR family transcriptional regulator [Peterkaempfera griseoplana]|uniref:TetR/AcrR family transcriptional regulator n=1 Tax=Peterkaempfera griseoplana TaxID=66896 RepID=UPI0006E1E8A9|nr:TetR/AcrR family transcriptional regulator [Peterkaempfera griseoplana]
MPEVQQPPDPRTGARRPQQQRSREKVARILAATGRLLEEHPYDEIGTRLIAAEAGVSVGVLYRFFPDKEAIVASLVRDWLRRFVEISQDTAAGPLPERPEDLHRLLIEAYADFFRSEPGFRRIWWGGPRIPMLQSESDANDQDVADTVHALLVGHYGAPDTPEARRRTLMAVVLVGHLLNLAFRDRPEGDPQVLSEAAVLLDRYLVFP